MKLKKTATPMTTRSLVCLFSSSPLLLLFRPSRTCGETRKDTHATKNQPPKQRAPLAALNGNSEVVATAMTTATANAKLSSSSSPRPAPAPAPAQVEVRKSRALAPFTPARRRRDEKRENWKKANGERDERAALLFKEENSKQKKLNFFRPRPLSLSHPSTSAAGDGLERGHALGALQGKGHHGRGSSSSSRCCCRSRSRRPSPPRHTARGGGRRLLLPAPSSAPATAARLVHPFGPARRPPPRVLPELPDPEHQDRVRRRG